MRPRARLVALALAALAACATRAAHAGSEAPTPAFPSGPRGDESVAVTDDASGFLANPAAGGLRYPRELQLLLGDGDPGGTRYGVIGSIGGFGAFAGRGRDAEQAYGVGGRIGDDPLRLGGTLALRISELTGEHVWDSRLGVLSRPAPWLSVGGTLAHLTQPGYEGGRLAREYTVGMALRPLAWSRPRAFAAGPRLTLSADLLMRERANASQARTRFGAELELMPGILLRGTLEDHGRSQIALSLLEVGHALHLNSASAEGSRARTRTATLSLHGAEDRTVLALPASRRLAEIEISGVLGDESMGGISALGGDATREIGSIHRQLKRALEDPLTRGVLLDIDGVAGMAQLDELRPRIAQLRAAGKPVLAYLEEGGGRGDLYLASACDRIVTIEEANFMGLGLRVEKRYWRRFLADFGVRLDRSSVGRYKSAFREFSVDSLPASDRESIDRTLDQVQEAFVSTVALDRHMERARLTPLLDGRRWSPRDLQRAGLIDSIGDHQDALAWLGSLAGIGDAARAVDVADHPASQRAWTLPQPIAVVYASGGIDGGESGNDLLLGPTLGARTLIEQLRAAFEDASVRAVVLRIDSPGGSVVASNLIQHAIERLTREHHKPLVVSMAGTAASGGYYIAMSGRPIIAGRMTRTGSIGVLFVKPSFEGFFTRHGVHEQDLERGDAMRGLSSARDWDAAAQASADSSMMGSYRLFVRKVAAARGLSEAAVDSAAQGRVWLGEDALRLGLVDRLGGLEEAIAEARKLGEVPDGERIRVRELRRPAPSLLERLVGAAVRESWQRSMRLPDFDDLLYRMGDDVAP